MGLAASLLGEARLFPGHCRFAGYPLVQLVTASGSSLSPASTVVGRLGGVGGACVLGDLDFSCSKPLCLFCMSRCQYLLGLAFLWAFGLPLPGRPVVWWEPSVPLSTAAKGVSSDFLSLLTPASGK